MCSKAGRYLNDVDVQGELVRVSPLSGYERDLKNILRYGSVV